MNKIKISLNLETIIESFNNLEIWSYALSSLIGLLISYLFFSTVDTTLTNFNNRTIGIVVLEGVDANIRTLAYVKTTSIYILVLFFSLIAIAAFIKRQGCSTRPFLESEKQSIYYLAITYHFVFLLSCLNPENDFTSVQSVLLFAIIVNALLFGMKTLSYNDHKKIYHLLSNKKVNLISLFFPFTFLVVLRAVLGKDIVLVDSQHFSVYFLLWGVFYLLYALSLLVIRQTKIAPANWTKGLVDASLPLFTIPLFLLVANEIQYVLSRRGYIYNVYLFSYFAIILLSVVSIFIAYRVIKGLESGASFEKTTKRLLFITFLTITMYDTYIGELVITKFDMFHTGEALLPTQQLFSFGKLPFVNIWATHGGSDFFLDVLFSWLNGGFSLEVLAFGWVLTTIYAALAYIVLARIFNPTLSFLILLVSQASFIQRPSYLILGLLAIQLPGILRRDVKFKKYILYWGSVFFVLFWRVDFGILAIISSIIIITSKSFFQKTNDNDSWRRRSITHHVQAILSLALMVLVFIVLIWSNQQVSILSTIKTIYMFLKIQTQSVSYAALTPFGPTQTFFYYVFLPSITLVYPISWILLLTRKEENEPTKVILTFISVFMLLIFMRAFQRHSLMEGYQYGLFVLLAAALPTFFINKKQIAYFLFLIILSYFYLVIPISTHPLLERYIQLRTWKQGEDRVLEDQTQYDDFSKFMSSQLEQEQTFYDFSNSPMLYVVTDREFIPYIIPNLYITSEYLQIAELQRLDDAVKQQKVPFVVFYNPIDYWNYVDNVPNEIRSYRISEYIYKNYKPYANVGGYAVWVYTGYEPIFNKFESSKLSFINDIDQQFNLGLLPYYWGEYDPLFAIENSKKIQEIISEPIWVTRNSPRSFSLETDIAKTNGNYLHLRILAEQETSLNISYGNNEEIESSINFRVVPSNRPVDYMIRISTQWDWVSKINNVIQIKTDSKVEILSFNITTGD